IRGDFSIDSPDLATKEKRALKNLVHASSSVKEAKREISLWFEI
ncbi:MAG: nucleoside-diphosphate kinase, partial [Candidatus Atribacteria bacterium]|nr:nucleoside-diphosphate kinase [Candidatus Atribacteria bacterium]